MRRMAVLSEWLGGGNQSAGELGGHRCGQGGGAIEAQLPETCAWGRR
jgi:hypothetical protein